MYCARTMSCAIGSTITSAALQPSRLVLASGSARVVLALRVDPDVTKSHPSRGIVP
jgi:hypothetical protein